MRTPTLLLATLWASNALADPPTPPPKPERWEFLGTYQVGVGAGRGPINTVIDPDSIYRHGDIVNAFIGRGFIQVDGHWRPDRGWFIVSYKIDCKYHTYNELWYETDLGYKNMDDQWITIEPDGEVALAEKRLCAIPDSKEHDRHRRSSE